MPAYETKASVRKYLAKGPEVVNHYVLLMVDAHISKQVALIVEITRQEVLCHNKIAPTESIIRQIITTISREIIIVLTNNKTAETSHWLPMKKNIVMNIFWLN